MSPIHKLNADLLHHLFAFLDTPDLLIATRVCFEWHVAAQIEIDGTLDLIATTPMQTANLNILSRLETDIALQHRVSGIEILEWHLEPPPGFAGAPSNDSNGPWGKDGYFSSTYPGAKPSSPAASALLNALATVLAVAQLRKFTWSAIPPLPEKLISILAALPACGVHINRNSNALETSFWSYFPQLNLRQVARLGAIRHNLRTMEVIMPTRDLLVLTALGRLASSTKLDSLSVYMLGRRTCPAVAGEPLRPTADMSWILDHMLDSGHKLSLRRLRPDNFCVCGNETPFQLHQLTDIARLDHLAVSCFSIVSGCNNALQPHTFHLSCSQIKQLDETAKFCAREWTAESVRHFLSECIRLKELVITDNQEILTEEVVRHLGPQLRDLQYHSISLLSSRVDMEILDPMVTLPSSWLGHCQNLLKLTIDTPIPRAKAFAPYVSSYLESLPSLDRLTCYCVGEPWVYATHDEIVPDDRKSIICDAVSELHEQLRRLQHRLTALCIAFEPRPHWDRDPMVTRIGRRPTTQSGTFISEIRAPIVFGCPPTVQAQCMELQEVCRAQRHLFSEVHPHYWAFALARYSKLALEESAVVRRTHPGPIETQVQTCSR